MSEATQLALPELTVANYHQHKAMSRSKLNDYHVGGPREYEGKHVLPKDHPRFISSDKKKTAEVEIGTAGHFAILEANGREFDDLIAAGDRIEKIPKDVLAKNGAKSTDAWYAWRDERPGKILLKADEIECVRQIYDAVLLDEYAGHLFAKSGRSEVPYLWTDAETGLLCRCLIDREPEGVPLTIDLKTTADSSPAWFRNSTLKFGYHLQDAHYCEGQKSADGIDREFVFVVVPNCPPYKPVLVHQLEPRMRAHAVELRKRLMAELARRQSENDWADGLEGQPNVITFYERDYQ